jgi:5-methylcytosine-specific restriction endonuclease McrA
MAWSSSDRRSRLPADWPRRRAAILRRDGWLCQIAGDHCTRFATEVDHIQPSDDHRLDNLQAVCGRCHAEKTAGEAKAAQAVTRARGRRPAEPHPGWGMTPPGPPPVDRRG